MIEDDCITEGMIESMVEDRAIRISFYLALCFIRELPETAEVPIL